jgi:hypothetical protein
MMTKETRSENGPQTRSARLDTDGPRPGNRPVTGATNAKALDAKSELRKTGNRASRRPLPTLWKDYANQESISYFRQLDSSADARYRAPIRVRKYCGKITFKCPITHFVNLIVMFGPQPGAPFHGSAGLHKLRFDGLRAHRTALPKTKSISKIRE